MEFLILLAFKDFEDGMNGGNGEDFSWKWEMKGNKEREGGRNVDSTKDV